MTRKDYVEVAAVFRSVWDTANRSALGPLYVLAERLADTFEAGNPAFDRDRFLAACHGGNRDGAP